MTGLIHCGDLRASLVEIIITISIVIGNGSIGVIPERVPIVWIKDGVTKDNANDSCTTLFDRNPSVTLFLSGRFTKICRILSK